MKFVFLRRPKIIIERPKYLKNIIVPYSYKDCESNMYFQTIYEYIV